MKKSKLTSSHRLFVNILTLCTLSAPLTSFQICMAGEQVGTLTQVQGTVNLFTHPSKTLPKENGDAPRALFEGEYFLVQDAKIGDPVEKGNILRTAPGSQARVVFENGDQINVSASTAYRITWDQDTNKGKTELKLAYGKIRGIVTQGGPRSRLMIKTKSAVMGIRGTDFFVAQGGSAQKSTELTVMRGAVEITPLIEKTTPSHKNETTEVKPAKIQTTLVKAGYSADITSTQPSPSSNTPQIVKVEPKVELRQTTKEEFIGIQTSSTIQKRAIASTSNTSQETQNQVQNLENKAVETALQDIKKHDQDFYAQLEKDSNKTGSLEQINQATLQKLYKEAPKGPALRKPSQSEIDDIGDGAYEKYFKRIN
jgi:hypothetical protein